jgi:hypothetical protein
MPATSGQRARRARPFTLWQEVAVAYLAPAVSAGAGAVITGQSGLALAAFTSIGLTSAVVAALIGGRLQRGGATRHWSTSLPRAVVTVGMGLFGAAVGGCVGWFTGAWLPAHTPLPDAAWITRLRFDLPLSAALASAIVTWRWRGARTA